MYNDSNGVCTSKRIEQNSIEATETKREYVLLPVYMVNVKYNGKMYPFAMNGQTGEFIGDIPVDNKKAWMQGLATFAITFAIIIVISLIFFFIGGVK